MMLNRRLISNLVIIAAALCLCQTAFAKETPTVELKDDTIRHLRELRTQNVKHLTDLDSAIRKRFDDKKLTNFEEEVQSLKAEQQEYSLRLDFINRLIAQLDKNYVGGDLRKFLETALLDMAKVDATATSTAGDGLWKFLKYSAEAIQRLPEQKENILAFLEGYMNLSVMNPVLPEQYLATRNYTNGLKSEQGNPMSRDEVGAVADQRLKKDAPAPPSTKQ